MTPAPCRRCGSAVVLRRQVIANGTSQFAWYCLACQRWNNAAPGASPVWLAHDWLRQTLAKQNARLEDVPIVADYSAAAACVICGAPGELQHFAPQCLAEVFGGDWNTWPTANLCPLHHGLWHRVVTPHLRKTP